MSHIGNEPEMITLDTILNCFWHDCHMKIYEQMHYVKNPYYCGIIFKIYRKYTLKQLYLLNVNMPDIFEKWYTENSVT